MDKKRQPSFSSSELEMLTLSLEVAIFEQRNNIKTMLIK